MIRIVVVDDHALIREGVKKIIRSSRDMSIVGEAVNIEESIRLISQSHPDIVILDMSLPGHDGVEGLVEVRQQFPNIPVLVLSMYPEERFAIHALKAGAAGYITKSMAAEEVVRGIQKIISGGSYISPRLAELLAMDVRKPRSADPHERLTIREFQVASLLGSGKQIKQIAAELSISISSVNTYRTRIFKKMGLSSNAALIRYTIERGLIQ